MGAVCSKVYTLERVLKFKGDSATGVNFLEQALSVSASSSARWADSSAENRNPCDTDVRTGARG